MTKTNLTRLLFLIIVFVIVCSNAFCKDFELIEKAIQTADKRLAQGILLDDITEDKTFETQAGKQIEFALIDLKAERLLTEEWYDLALYCLARKHKRYKLALKILKREYEIEQFPIIKDWIKTRINLLEKPNFAEDDYDIGEDIRKISVTYRKFVL